MKSLRVMLCALPLALTGCSTMSAVNWSAAYPWNWFGSSTEVTEQANTAFLDRMTELLGESLFTMGNCATARSYYFNPAGEPTLLRPSSTESAIKEASEFPLSDYQIV